MSGTALGAQDLSANKIKIFYVLVGKVENK
jgi:hypothetical protein